MTFSIELLEQSPHGPDSVRFGIITIGSFVERFTVATDYWGVTQYRRHWREAVTRIVQGFGTSALITSMYDPAVANFICWWPMYLMDHTVYFQNHILFLSELDRPFDPNDPFRSVPERARINSDDDKISEWSASLAELESFLNRVIQ